ncbi:MAG: Hsp20/alpha crystallin family protein, partial [Desulfohalobiaceae bacterium]
MFRRFLPTERRSAMETPQSPRTMFDLMEDLWRTPLETGLGQMEYPAVNISEDDRNITVEAELPGMDSKDIDISLQNNMLVLQGEKKFEDERNEGNYQRIERSYGAFSRTIPLSSSVDEDNVKASFKNGILTVTLPKQEKAQGKKIAI